MKCFYFSHGERREAEEEAANCGNNGSVVSGGSSLVRVSWAWSIGGGASNASNVEGRSSGLESTCSDFRWRNLSRSRNDLRVFEFAELKLATKGFSRALIIGEGGFGSVYKGVVGATHDPNAKMEVAIKQLNRNGLQGHKEWMTEVNFLGVVKHPNLVKLVGYCAEDGERGIQRLLVYELMPNRSLEDHLLARFSEPLPWVLRLRIAQDAARGLAYLHEEMEFQLIFRDFKASNILLDSNFNAKLSDFGLAREGPAEGFSHISTAVVGTIGYAAPEYVQTGRLTAKSDVWSYGVVLYELMTGRRSVDKNRPRSEQKLLEWVRPYASDPKRFRIIMDARLEGQYCLKSVQKLIALANRCLMRQPRCRPKMSEVVESLNEIIEIAHIGSQEAADKSLSSVVTGLEKIRSNSKRIFDFKEKLIHMRNKENKGLGVPKKQEGG
ncbi:serine/threonine-protein kinase PCRK1-like [Nymphaea colorata]|nr:serine/threonine-protein kinase PCRK1-like [Nymphaea colorata]